MYFSSQPFIIYWLTYSIKNSQYAVLIPYSKLKYFLSTSKFNKSGWNGMGTQLVNVGTLLTPLI